ncbi:MAG: haloacid dehalogenase-like hydrolase [Deltaproteobacteria bacterium]|nr:haloacid dehalogenase-like hydrolase [Deltaproteobacteria bacterium]MBI4373257.1 haloacid dehalogenase-like hydrolase [Deltaproteobacteria bacterium]
MPVDGHWTPIVGQRLSSLLLKPNGERSGRLAVFDLDNTTIKNDCGEAFFHFLAEEGRLPPSRIREYYEKARKEGGPIAYPWVVSLMAGMKEAEVYSLCKEAIRKELKKEIGEKELGGVPIAQGIRPYPEMKGLMKQMKQAGFEIWVISASNRWVVETTIQEIGLTVDHFIGMAVTVEDGLLTNSPVKPQPAGPGKREVIEQKIGRPPNFVAGDSASDFPMMELATDGALLIDHGRKECQTMAEEKGWMIQPAFSVR